MSDTPRTPQTREAQLERQLAAAKAKIAELESNIDELTETPRSQDDDMLRDWFAGMAINQLVKMLCEEARDEEFSNCEQLTIKILTKPENDGVSYFSQSAQAAYSIADAMLAARKGGA